jgi:hypothetical protein
MLKCVFVFAISILSFGIGGCAGSPKVLAVSDLSQNLGSGSQTKIEGVIGRANRRGDKSINVIYFHGMGWTQENGSQLGNDFVEAVLTQIPQSSELPGLGKCSEGQVQETPGTTVFPIDKSLVVLPTDLKGTNISLGYIGCMDRVSVALPNDRILNVFRVYWDSYFWNASQYPHVGYDDSRLGPNDSSQLGQRSIKQQLYRDILQPPSSIVSGGRVIADQRATLNREFKDSLVTHGLSDAALYMGELGPYMKRMVRLAICEAFNQSGGNPASRALSVSIDDISRIGSKCEQPDVTSASWTMISESLGSRILFDALKDGSNISFNSAISKISDDSELFMLANQIPLLGLASTHENEVFSEEKKPRIIAMSEVNDFLTYELVPYFENLYVTGCSATLTNGSPTRCDQREQRLLELTNRPELRAELVRRVGFGVVDVRLQFARRIGNLGAHPLDAHTGHMENPMVARIVLCGLRDGRTNSC